MVSRGQVSDFDKRNSNDYYRVMGNYNDDERSNAYNRHIYFEFASIVQHYNNTARPEHDDIDFVPATVDELDGIEFDYNGDYVTPVDDFDEFNDFIVDLISAIDRFGSFEDIPDDYEFAGTGDALIDIVVNDNECDCDDCAIDYDDDSPANYIVINIYRGRPKPDKT